VNAAIRQVCWSASATPAHVAADGPVQVLMPARL